MSRLNIVHVKQNQLQPIGNNLVIFFHYCLDFIFLLPFLHSNLIRTLEDNVNKKGQKTETKQRKKKNRQGKQGVIFSSDKNRRCF